MKRLLTLLVLVAFTATHCSKDASNVGENKSQEFFTCDAESKKGDFLKGKSGGFFANAAARSSERSRSGKYSLRLFKDNAYGFNYTVKNVKKGTVITAEVWKNSNAKTGAVVVSPFKSKETYASSGHFREFQGEWGKVTTMFVAEQDFDSINVFAYNLAEEPVFFDDLTVGIYRNNTKPKEEKGQLALHLEIPHSASDSLEQFRKIALEQGVIGDDQKDYVRAFVKVNGDKAPVELRLKGDWIDHLETEKISFRIKMGDGYAFDGLKTFSIQHPQARSYAMEWFAHQLFEQEGILTTRYEMIPVFINGKNCGVYAMEEHFDKQLLEARKRREGPIMKFDESGMWQVNMHMTVTGQGVLAPVIPAAEISVFKKGRTKRTPTLFAQFLEGQSHMEKYRQGAPDVASYMDLEAMAKYLALLELTNGKHGLTWHNQRFYMNPITQKLEPIAFDCFMEYNLLQKKHSLIALKNPKDREYLMSRGLLKDPKLFERYEYYLRKFSKPEYLQKSYKKLEKKIDRVEALLRHEYPNVTMGKDHFEYYRASIRNSLSKLKNARAIVPESYEVSPYPENIIFDEIALKSHLQKYNADSSAQMSLSNFHSHEIEIIGYTVKGDGIGMIPIPPVKLAAYKTKPDVKVVRFPVKPRRIHYKAANCGDSIFKCNPEEWPRATPKESNSLNKAVNVSENSEYHMRGKLIFNDGVVIPKCKALVIEPGTEIVLGKGAYIVSYAPVLAKGTANYPIVIHGNSDATQGFVCLSDRPSKIQYTTFDGLGTMKEGNWRLTGAVTFYNADVTIAHCTFRNNHCEDALNTISCTVDMTHSLVENTYSDGYDADFCQGTVRNCDFKSTGNDCIDFSGSKYDIDHCTIKNSGDKGISGGEGSNLTVTNCIIEGAQIAVASKDRSNVTVSNISIKKADIAYAAYCKKPEYGGAKLIVDSEKLNNAAALHLIELGSKLLYFKKEIKGKEKFNIDEMYAQFEK